MSFSIPPASSSFYSDITFNLRNFNIFNTALSLNQIQAITSTNANSALTNVVNSGFQIQSFTRLDPFPSSNSISLTDLTSAPLGKACADAIQFKFDLPQPDGATKEFGVFVPPMNVVTRSNNPTAKSVQLQLFANGQAVSIQQASASTVAAMNIPSFPIIGPSAVTLNQWDLISVSSTDLSCFLTGLPATSLVPARFYFIESTFMLDIFVPAPDYAVWRPVFQVGTDPERTPALFVYSPAINNCALFFR